MLFVFFFDGNREERSECKSLCASALWTKVSTLVSITKVSWVGGVVLRFFIAGGNSSKISMSLLQLPLLSSIFKKEQQHSLTTEPSGLSLSILLSFSLVLKEACLASQNEKNVLKREKIQISQWKPGVHQQACAALTPGATGLCHRTCLPAPQLRLFTWKPFRISLKLISLPRSQFILAVLCHVTLSSPGPCFDYVLSPSPWLNFSV